MLLNHFLAGGDPSVAPKKEKRGGTPVKAFLAGIIVTLVAIPIFGLLYIRSSYMSVAATDAPLPFEETLAHMALHERIEREAPQRDVSHLSTADLVSGAALYQKHCAFCHGLPQQPSSAASQGMFPRAPQLFTEQESVSDDPAGVTYWKLKNGIRLSGMPSFQGALTEDQMWEVAALLSRAEQLPPEVREALKPAPPSILISAGAGLPPSAEKPK
jgi:thiosulfate dehydrogenase